MKVVEKMSGNDLETRAIIIKGSLLKALTHVLELGGAVEKRAERWTQSEAKVETVHVEEQGAIRNAAVKV